MSASPNRGASSAPPSPARSDSAPPFPLEGLYVDVDDRATILALPEIEREVIIAERAQQALHKKQDSQLKHALAQTRLAAGKANKRKADAANLDDDDKGKRTTRPKADTVKTSKSALDDYKRARELKTNDRKDPASSGPRDRRSSSPAENNNGAAHSDRDADGDSEVEWAEPTSTRLKSSRDDPPATLQDFERTRIGRSNFAKICFYPGFEDAIKGCFARVSIGADRDTHQNLYRMTQIKTFVEGRPYQLEYNGKTFTTDQYAVVAHGRSEKPWPFSACSDGRFTDQEFDRFKATLDKEDLKRPVKKYLDARLDAIKGLLELKWGEEQISQKLAKQRKMAWRHDPANATAVKTQRITDRKAKAEAKGDAEETARCEAELAALANATALSTTTTDPTDARPIIPIPTKLTPKIGRTNQEKLALLNQKNRGKNTEDIRRALLEEKRKLALAREQAGRENRAKAEADAAKKRDEEAKAARLLAPPATDMSELFGESEGSRAGTPARSRAGTPLPGRKARVKESAGGVLGVVKRRREDDEVIGGLDLGIDVEIEI